MNIKRATVEDLETIAPMGESFAREGGFPFVVEKWKQAWSALLKSGVGEVLFATRQEGSAPAGVLAVVYAPSLNDGELMGQECGWFVNKEERGCGIRLLVAAEKSARDRGAARFCMAHLCGLNDRLGELYTRRGYRPVETYYVLNL